MTKADMENGGLRRIIHSLCAVLLSMVVSPERTLAQKHQQPKPTGVEAIPEPAVPAILAAFDKYEIVGLPAAHEGKDLDDFILLLVLPPKLSDDCIFVGGDR